MPTSERTPIEFDRLFETLYDGTFRFENHIQVIASMRAMNRKAYNEFASLAKNKCRSEYIKMENQLKYGSNTTQARGKTTHLQAVDKSASGQLLVKEVYPACPVTDTAIVPYGWAMRSNEHGDAAIVKLGEGDTKAKALLGHPLVVTAVLSNILTGDVILEIAWQFHSGGSWKIKQIAKSVLGSKQRLAVEMASWGTAVNANNAGGVIEWLTDYQAANTGSIEARKTSPQLGWCRGGFLLPGDYITKTGEPSEVVQFVPESEGIAQIRDALIPRGTLSGWIAAIANIADYPLVTTGIYAALSSVLVESLMPTDSNPIIDWSYRTSTGKTTTLQIAASVWGDPRDMIVAWDGTQQGLTGRAIAMNHLPTIIDDSKTAREYGGKSSVPRIIYALSGGTDSVRNSTTGLKKTYRFRTVAMSTGEDKAVDSDKSGGTVARVLSIWGAPFGGESDEIKQRINRAKIGIDANTGVAGPVFIRYVVDNYSKLELWKAEIERETRRVQEFLSLRHGVPGGMLDRCAKIIGLLQVTANIAHDCLPIPWVKQDLVKLLAPLIASDTISANRDQEAMDWILGRVAASPGRIVSDPGEYQKTMGSTSLLGVDGLPCCRVAMFPPMLDSELRAGGFNPKSILRTWFDNGWAEKGTVDWLQNGEKLIMLHDRRSRT